MDTLFALVVAVGILFGLLLPTAVVESRYGQQVGQRIKAWWALRQYKGWPTHEGMQRW